MAGLLAVRGFPEAGDSYIPSETLFSLNSTAVGSLMLILWHISEFRERKEFDLSWLFVPRSSPFPGNLKQHFIALISHPALKFHCRHSARPTPSKEITPEISCSLTPVIPVAYLSSASRNSCKAFAFTEASPVWCASADDCLPS